MKSKTLKSIIASMLAFIMVLAPVSQVMAATDKEYLSEVVTSDTKEWLEKNKYTVVDQDLNEKAKGSVYLGYKTTTDPTKAITDLSIMDMNGGYSVTAYKNMLADRRSQIEELVNELIVSIGEFQENYKAGTIQAKSAYETLNHYYEDDSKQKMGDFLVNLKLKNEEIDIQADSSDKEILKKDGDELIKEVVKILQDQEMLAKNTLVKLIMESNRTIFNAVIEQIALGCTDKDNSNSWIDRLSKVDTSKKFPNTYESDARMILDGWEKLSDSSFSALDVENDLKGKSDKEKEQYYDNMSINEQSDFLLGESIKNSVDNKKYNNKAMIDFFATEADDLTVTDLYPLVSVLTPGQLAIAKYYGISTLAAQTITDEKVITDINESVEKTANEQEEKAPTSIYTGVDRRFFNGDVALTNEAMTKMNSSDNKTFWETDVSNTVIFSAIAVASVGLLSAAFATGYLIHQRNTIGVHMWGNAYRIYRANHYTLGNYDVLLNPAGCYVIIGISIGLMLLGTGLYFGVKWYNYTHPDYKTIPQIMVDERKDDDDNTYYVNYYAAENQKGKPNDLNNLKGKQWNVLYYSKDAKAGKPILATVFAQKGNKSSEKSGFVPVHGFSSTAAFNTNKNTYENSFSSNPPEIYLFFEQDEKALTGSTFSTGMLAIVVAVSVVAGVALGVGGTVLVNKRKKEEKQAK